MRVEVPEEGDAQLSGGEGAGSPVPSLRVEHWGEGSPPVILVHGFGAGNHSWRKWIPGLARAHRVLGVELMGFGQAPAPTDGDYSPPAQARRLARLVRTLGGDPPVLVGHSLGATAVLLATLELMAPEAPAGVRPAGLVIVSGAAYRQAIPPFLRLARIPGLGELFLLAPPPRWALRAGIRTIVSRKETVDAEQVDGYRAPLLDAGRRRVILRAARQIRLEDADRFSPRYGELDLPALLLWGGKDRVVPPRLGRRLEEDLPDARMVELAGVGHLPAEEAPDASLTHLLSFLRRVETG